MQMDIGKSLGRFLGRLGLAVALALSAVGVHAPALAADPVIYTGREGDQPFVPAKLAFAVADIPRIVTRARFREMTVIGATDKHAYVVEPNGGNMVELVPLNDLPDRPSPFSVQRVSFAKLITTDWHQIGDFLGNV